MLRVCESDENDSIFNLEYLYVDLCAASEILCRDDLPVIVSDTLVRL